MAPAPATLDPPSLALWPDVHWQPDYASQPQVNLDTLTQEPKSPPGSPAKRCCCRARCSPAATPRTSASQDMLAKGEKLPVDFTNRVIYYVGPVDPVRDEVVGPAGPTTATRMDKFTEMMLAQTGLIGMIGKAERGPVGNRGDQEAQSGLPDGGRRRRLSRRRRRSSKSTVLAFADLGMEAIYEFE